MSKNKRPSEKDLNSAVEKLMPCMGQTSKEVCNPGLTKIELIAIADYIDQQNCKIRSLEDKIDQYMSTL